MGNLGGLFTWGLSQDSYEYPLLNAMNEALGYYSENGVTHMKDQSSPINMSTDCREFKGETYTVFTGNATQSAMEGRYNEIIVKADKDDAGQSHSYKRLEKGIQSECR